MKESRPVPDALTVWTLNAITQLLLQKRFTESSLFLISTISASNRVVRHIRQGTVVLVFYYEIKKFNKRQNVKKEMEMFNTLVHCVNSRYTFSNQPLCTARICNF